MERQRDLEGSWGSQRGRELRRAERVNTEDRHKKGVLLYRCLTKSHVEQVRLSCVSILRDSLGPLAWREATQEAGFACSGLRI